MLVNVLTTLCGYAVTTVESASPVVGVARELQPSTFLDLGPPFEEIPVVVVTSVPERLTAQQRAMATAVLAKPLNIGQLLAVLRRLHFNAQSARGWVTYAVSSPVLCSSTQNCPLH